MKRYATVEGTRQEILTELDAWRRGSTDWQRAREFANAVTAIGAGADQVFVDGVLYRVVKD